MVGKLFNNPRLPSGLYMGFYYRCGYFLLPQEYRDYQAFMTVLRQKGTPMEVDTIVLEEDWQVEGSGSYEHGVSIAPYFITDYIDSVVTLSIEDADDVYPVMVELLTQKEYNNRLRTLVKEYCPGCSGFGSVNERDSSLSGHFGEISLNGVCVYRTEGRRSPRVFMGELRSFVRWWEQLGYSAAAADRIMDDIKNCLNLKYNSGEIVEEDGLRTLKLQVKKGDILLSELTRMTAEFVSAQADENYRIELQEGKPSDAGMIDDLIAPEKIAATRKLLKKYGVSVAVLTFDPAGEAKMTDFLEGLTLPGMGPARLMKAEPGRRVCLFTDTPEILRWLRYCSPMLQALETKLVLYDEEKTVRYRISHDMNSTIIDGEVQSKPLPKKRIRKIAAEEGRVLSRSQVADMFTYVSIRLNSDGCDHTTRFTEIWLEENLPEDKVAAALEEIRGMNGMCDCEVLMNCYEDYDLD